VVTSSAREPAGAPPRGLDPACKVLTWDEALRWREAAAGRVVFTNGVFDLLHPGHVDVLTSARRRGDALIVGLNSDASVTRYKGPTRPIVPQSQRAEMLLALRMVDYVHIFDESDPIAFLQEVKPDVHVNGSEYGYDCIESDTVRRNGGTIHIVDKLPGLSTTNLLTSLQAGAAARN
jgi:D-glycero-beta-D-manno-heptose 1-phosphate adenylyltransferase